MAWQKQASKPLLIRIAAYYYSLIQGYNGTTRCINENCSKNSIVSDNNSGEIVCSQCGSVLVEKAEVMGPEVHTFSTEEYLEKTRTGSKSSLAWDDMGLSTVIDSKDKDAGGNSLSSEIKSTFNRLRMWDARSKSDSSERSLRRAFTVLNSAKSKLSLSDTIIEKAAYYYRKILIKKMTRGRNINAMALASLYLACREANTPRTVQDLADAGNISVRALAKHVRILIQALDITVESYNSAQFINRISSSAGVSEKTVRYALELLEKTKENGFASGKNPVALAATVLYLACMANSEKLTQKKIASAAGISSVTIRNRSMSLVKILGIKNILTKHAIV
ncbi:MAG: transcription initiation factor IIB [Thaumarchaeota archaeon]|nr:transcription initiation factor IIB [Nitrososphaerota archaeon]